MHISILTASGKYNLGDELILAEEFRHLKNHFPRATFSVFTYDTESLLINDSQIETMTFFPNKIKQKPLKNIIYFFQNIWTIFRSDLIVIGGGGLIYDRETQKNMLPMFQWKARVFLAKLFRKKILWWAVGINLLEENMQKIHFLFSGKNSIVTVRDEKSLETLKKIWIESRILPDVVFGYVPSSHKPQATSHKPTVGISLRSGYLKNEIESIRSILEFLLQRNYQIVFLSQSIHPDDQNANDKIFTEQFVNSSKIQSTKTIEETLEAYKTLDFVIWMRLHSCILSVVHSIPFLALSYETKTRELLSDLDYHFSLEANNFNITSFQTLFSDLESKADDVKFALQQKNDTIKADLWEKIQSLLSQF